MRGVDHSQNLCTPSWKEVKFKQITQILLKFRKENNESKYAY